MKKYLIEYKTSIMGGFGLTSIALYYCNIITTEQLLTAVAFCTSLAAIASSDAK